MRPRRTVEVRTVTVPSIPLEEALRGFLTDLRWKTSRLSGRRLTAGTIDKYRWYLQRFERWLAATGLPSDLGLLTEDDSRLFQEAVLDEIDAGVLQESSAATYIRCVKTLFASTWKRLELDFQSNPVVGLRGGNQAAVDFPLFKEEHVKALLKAAVRPRPPNVSPWIPNRDQAMLACFFDLGWRVGEACKAELDDVDLRTGSSSRARTSSYDTRAGPSGSTPRRLGS